MRLVAALNSDGRNLSIRGFPVRPGSCVINQLSSRTILLPLRLRYFYVRFSSFRLKFNLNLTQAVVAGVRDEVAAKWMKQLEV